ncbi:hypothetical protein DL98DRAFT_610954 [Cadophora sp. DSE1049]|nr:hypothetical protein DL98DRAFT_610954 [Cadophora sp. DSE1049]
MLRGKIEEPELKEIFDQRRPSTIEAMNNTHRKSVSNRGLTGASALTVRQSIFPITFVTLRFFLWVHFAYSLLGELNSKFQTVLNITAAKAGGLQGAYFGAYLIGPLTYSGWSVRKFGYRWTVITGLYIYGVGALMFWPSASTAASEVSAEASSSLAPASPHSKHTLETSANPFIATYGPPRLSEFLMASLLASRVFFSHTDPNDLSKAQLTLIPEGTDADMALQAEQLRRQYKLMFCVAAQYCYVGAQFAVASNFINYARESAGSSLFAIGRFAAAGLMMFMEPCLVVFMTAIIISSPPQTVLKPKVASLCFLWSSSSNPVSPPRFSRSLSVVLVATPNAVLPGLFASISGGALFPSLTGLLADSKDYHIAMAVPLIGIFVAFAYPIYLNLRCRKELDGFRETKIGWMVHHWMRMLRTVT